MKFAYPYRLILPFLLAAAVANPTDAAEEARDAFEALNSCVQREMPNQCRQWVTASSATYYDRFVKNNVVRCFPKDAAYVETLPAAHYAIVRARTGKGMMRLYFAEEEGAWKFDIPETMRNGLGAHWQKKVDGMEQLYLVMKMQLGNQLNCGALQALVQKQ